jgi:hypothetical protein
MPNMNEEFERACEVIDKHIHDEQTMMDDTTRDQFKSWLDRFNALWVEMESKANFRKNKEYEWEPVMDARARSHREKWPNKK